MPDEEPLKLIVIVKSSDNAQTIDLEITVLPGGSFDIKWHGGNNAIRTVTLPGRMRDQKRWVCDKNGMRPLNEEDPQ